MQRFLFVLLLGAGWILAQYPEASTATKAYALHTHNRPSHHQNQHVSYTKLREEEVVVLWAERLARLVQPSATTLPAGSNLSPAPQS